MESIFLQVNGLREGEALQVTYQNKPINTVYYFRNKAAILTSKTIKRQDVSIQVIQVDKSQFRIANLTSFYKKLLGCKKDENVFSLV